MPRSNFVERLTKFTDTSWDPIYLKAGNAYCPLSTIDITPNAVSWSGTVSVRPTFNNTPSQQLTGFFPPLVITASFTGTSTTLYAKISNSSISGTDYMLGTDAGWFVASNGATHYPFKICEGQHLAFCVVANKATGATVTITNTTAGSVLGTFSATIN